MPAPWKKSYDQPRQHITKQRHYFANKGPSSQSYDFSSSHVWMWGWTIKKAEHRRIDAFEFWCCAWSQCEESRPWQGHEEGSWHTQGYDQTSGVPLEFPEHPPPQKIRICLLFHSSNILWKKSTQGFSLLHLKGMFQVTPLNRFPQTSYSLWIAYSPPNVRGTKLKSILRIQSLF